MNKNALNELVFIPTIIAASGAVAIPLSLGLSTNTAVFAVLLLCSGLAAGYVSRRRVDSKFRQLSLQHDSEREAGQAQQEEVGRAQCPEGHGLG